MKKLFAILLFFVLVGLPLVALSEIGDPLFEKSVISIPSVSGASPIATGEMQYNSGTNRIMVGDSARSRVPFTEPFRVVIASPESQANPRAIIIPPSESGLTFWATGITFWATQSGCTLTGVSKFASGNTTWNTNNTTALWSDIKMTQGGVSRWFVSYLTGASPIPSESALILNWGNASTANYFGFTMTGYWSAQ